MVQSSKGKNADGGSTNARGRGQGRRGGRGGRRGRRGRGRNRSFRHSKSTIVNSSSAASGPPPKAKVDPSCQVCALHDWKYRCPTCGTHYCSLACSDTHQGEFCETRAAIRADEEVAKKEKAEKEAQMTLLALEERKANLSKSAKPKDSDQPSYIVSPSVLKKLDDHELIQKAIQDVELRRLLSQIVTDPEPRLRIQQEMESNEAFFDICNKVLQCIGIRDDQGHCLL